MSDKFLSSGFGINSSPIRPRDMEDMHRRTHYANANGDRKTNPAVKLDFYEPAKVEIKQKPQAKKFITSNAK